jgi:hypothetical protein
MPSIPARPIPSLTPEFIERFWSCVDQRGPDDCWPWCRHLHSGYGAIRYRGRRCLAHRLVYIIAHGSIPEGLDVLHRCPGVDRRDCCNPAHLYAGTPTQNRHDWQRKGVGTYERPKRRRGPRKLRVLYSVENRGYQTPCWLWQGQRVSGYGRRAYDGKMELAHRVAFAVSTGRPIAELDVIDHRCGVRHCMRPDHLEEVGFVANMRRARHVKLDDAQVAELRAAKGTITELAARFGVSRSTVKGIRSGTARNRDLGVGTAGDKVRPHTLLTPEIVRAIRASEERSGILARRYRVSAVTVRRIRSGQGWKHIE